MVLSVALKLIHIFENLQWHFLCYSAFQGGKQSSEFLVLIQIQECQKSEIPNRMN